jgi:hypothetical protein
MHVSKMRRLVASLTAAVALAGGSVAIASSPAQAATCKTVQLNSYWWTAIRPRMTVPICYDGSHVWQSGPVTGGVDAWGYVISMGWMGTYGSGGGWLGAGMNYQATLYSGGATFFCPSRWGINASGNVVSFDRGC